MQKKTMSPEEMVLELRKLRESLPMDGTPMNAQAILARLAEIRALLPLDGIEPVRKKESERMRRMDLRTQQDFDDAAVLQAVESLTLDVQAIVDNARQRAFESALDIYYKAEELARDPENAELIPHVEEIRKAYERSYGHPVPTKAETDARRAREERAKAKAKKG